MKVMKCNLLVGFFLIVFVTSAYGFGWDNYDFGNFGSKRREEQPQTTTEPITEPTPTTEAPAG